MAVLLLRTQFAVTIVFLVFILTPNLFAQSMGSDKALALAKEIPVVKAFYNLNQGALKECIESQVVRPCDSDWVTCIDDAWVVKFFLSESCSITKNEQLGVTLLIDEKTGKIISRYPEIEYFENPRFCREDYDCFCNQRDKASLNDCKNFIYTLAANMSLTQCPKCICREAKCVLADE